MEDIKWIHFHNFIGNVSFDLFLSSVRVWISCLPPQLQTALQHDLYTVYILWSLKAIKADISMAQKFIVCSRISWNAHFRFLFLSMGDCCPLTATVWFPWAVKQDHGRTIYDVFCADTQYFTSNLGEIMTWSSKQCFHYDGHGFLFRKKPTNGSFFFVPYIPF